MEKTLVQIARHLNERGIVWALGGSLVLKHHGLVKSARDIDILVTYEGLEAADEELSSLGYKQTKMPNPLFQTTYFYEYVINGIEVDLMCDFKIVRDPVYTYLFDSECVVGADFIEDVRIPYTSVEDWYILYQLMNRTDDKTQAIRQYLKLNGITHPTRWEKMIASVPEPLKTQITSSLR